MTNRAARSGLNQAARWILAGCAVALLAAGWPALRGLAGQLALSGVLCALALPIANFFQKKISRALSSGLAVGVLLLGAAGLIGLLAPTCVQQISWVIGQIPGLFAQIQEVWTEFSQREWVQALGIGGEGPGQWIQSLGAWAAGALPRVLSGIGAGADALSRAFLSPILTYYFLRDREAFAYRFTLWIPLRHRRRVIGALREMRREAAGYVRGQLLVGLAVGVLTALGLLVLGIPAWLALGLLMGACELIPYVGPIIGGIPIVLFSLPLGMEKVLWAVGITVAVQQIEGYFLSPRLMAGAVGLHPIYVLLLLSAGGMLWGLPGMILALPVFVCIRGAARAWSVSREETEPNQP